MRTNNITLFLAFLTIAISSFADDWPQWRGPSRDGISREGGLLQEWPAEGPTLLWQKEGLCEGYSTPAIVGNRIFLVGSKGNDNEFVTALSTKDGSQLWQTCIGKVGKIDQIPSYPGARSTVTVDGDLLYALGSNGDIVCLDIEKGHIRWAKNIIKDFSGSSGTWAYAESPLVDKDVVVVTPGGKDATLLSLNKKTGDVVRKFPTLDGDDAGYSSITIFNAAGKRQYIQFLSKGVVGVDSQSGKFLWRYDRTALKSLANIGTPVTGHNCVYSGNSSTGGGLVKLSPDGEGVRAEEIYFNKKLPTSIGGAVLVGDYLYGANRDLFICIDFKTGEQKWRKERTMAPSSLCYADGRLYLHGETNGDLALIEPSPEGYKEHGHFTPPGIPENRVGKAWTYPAIANGRLYIHDWGTLWCYNIKASHSARVTSPVTSPARN